MKISILLLLALFLYAPSQAQDLPYINTPYGNFLMFYKRGEAIASNERIQINGKYLDVIKELAKNNNTNNDLLIQNEVLKYKIDLLEKQAIEKDKQIIEKDALIKELIKK